MLLSIFFICHVVGHPSHLHRRALSLPTSPSLTLSLHSPSVALPSPPSSLASLLRFLLHLLPVFLNHPTPLPLSLTFSPPLLFLRCSQERRIAELEKRKAALAADEGDAAKAQLKGVEEELAEIAAAHAEYLRKEEELERWQREHPKWDVDNIGQETKSRTVINGYKETKKPDSKPEVRKASRHACL